MSNLSAAVPPLCDLKPEARDLTACNTLGLASHASACVVIERIGQLDALSELARCHASLLILGGGSNVVLPDRVPGLVARVALRGLCRVQEREDAWIVEAAAGEAWHDVVSACIAQGWDGLENLALIPGTVGAAPVQNIGAYGVELADRLDSVQAWHIPGRRMVHMTAADCRFAYRDSVFKRAHPGEWLIVSVRLALPRPWRPVLDYPDLQRDAGLSAGAPPTARTIFDAVCRIRRAKLPDPATIGNAGSFFKNPLVDARAHDRLLARFPGLVSYVQSDGRYKLAAGWLIDQCGWKGRALGSAGVHDRQALVLVNRGGAKADDVMALARAIQRDVMSRYGVKLDPEPVVVAGQV
ncbi:UDP-N-acetylmuramate dehydrogenase [Bordetella sp. FB-8]|uniref:UDP-N-acetylmuramate dehydrogenase n=1 Tax=Bordetella sp. FB-8 TaxID=1159870 RepID=UPI00047703BD|nr:UDP-N-acetylmuramate dehydrogenase [Bordetella sp. FB-8]